MALSSPKTFNVIIALTLLVFFGVGCGKANVIVYHDVESDLDYPRSVAVLPFSYDAEIAENKRPHVILRESFFNYFSYLGYTDLPLNTVDLKIAPTIKIKNNLNEIPNDKLRKILGTDAVIRGHIINSTNFTAGIYAETSIKAKLEMIDLRTGEVLWETEHNELSNSSIATPSVVDMIKGQTANSEVKEAYQKVAESFVLKVLEKIPDPSRVRQKEVSLPRIISVDSNIQGNSRLRANDLIYVSMEGDSGLTAYFDIGSFKTGIAMKEVSPGLYTGSYRVKAGDHIGSTLILASLTNRNGLTAKKFYKRAVAILKDSPSQVGKTK